MSTATKHAVELATILSGIDKDEVEATDGWWETSTGAEFGRQKLAEVAALFSTERQAREAAEKEVERLKLSRSNWRASAIGAGVCPSCSGGDLMEPCTDCLGTGWSQGLNPFDRFEAAEAKLAALHIVFDAMPGPQRPGFIEVETPDGRSISVGEWRPRADGFCELVIPRAIAPLDRPGAAPIPMLLFCPKCGVQHVDEATETWPNPPHRSHLCHACGTIWRPADVATVGIPTIDTKGSADTWGRCDAAKAHSDDPIFDSTDGAHPAWWRGEEAGVNGATRIVMKALAGDNTVGKCSHAGLQAACDAIEVQRKVLTVCRQQFLSYFNQHMAKKTPEADVKAKVNLQMAEMCAGALGDSL